jgi:hypothetical protein
MRTEGSSGELVTFSSTRGLDLDGILFSAPRNKTTVIHVHGSLGNFYQSHFLRIAAKRYLEAGVNLFSFNTAGHDGVAEGYRNKSEFLYVGGAIADFGECVFDIEGAVRFANQIAPRVVLQGHSIGCDRVLHYLIERRAKNEFILLSPCDSYQLQTNWIAPETVEEQISRLRAEIPRDAVFDWLSSREYGVRQGAIWTYPIPITRGALLSIMQGPPFSLMRIESPAEFLLEQRALVYIGGLDPLQVWPNDVMFQHFRKHIRGVTEAYVDVGDHMLVGCEDLVINRVVDWLSNYLGT